MSCTHGCNNGRDCKCRFEELKEYIYRQTLITITVIFSALILGEVAVMVWRYFS